MFEICEVEAVNVDELEGELVGLSAIRRIKNCHNELQVSQAVFWVKTQKSWKRGQMFLWDSDATAIQQLVLGKHYKFKAAVKEHEGKLILFFLPSQTIFEISNSQEAET
jgi:hypothetical protein